MYLKYNCTPSANNFSMAFFSFILYQLLFQILTNLMIISNVPNVIAILFFLLHFFTTIAAMSMTFFSATNLGDTFTTLSSIHVPIIWLFDTSLTTYQIVRRIRIPSNARFNTVKLNNSDAYND